MRPRASGWRRTASCMHAALHLWGHPAAIQVGHVACLMLFAMLLERLRRQLLCASAASISTPGSEVVRTNQGCDLTVVPPLMRVREIAASVLRRLGAAQPRLGAGAKADEAARAASKLMVRRVMPEVLLFVHLLPCAPSAVPFSIGMVAILYRPRVLCHKLLLAAFPNGRQTDLTDSQRGWFEGCRKVYLLSCNPPFSQAVKSMYR